MCRNLGVGAYERLHNAACILIADVVETLALDTAAYLTKFASLVVIQHADNIGNNGIVVDKAILRRRDCEWHTVSIICCEFHLVDIPLATQIRGVHNTNIRADALHLLAVPEWEGVVIAIVDDDGVLGRRVEVVATNVTRHISSRTVVVIPVLGSKDHRYA